MRVACSCDVHLSHQQLCFHGLRGLDPLVLFHCSPSAPPCSRELSTALGQDRSPARRLAPHRLTRSESCFSRYSALSLGLLPSACGSKARLSPRRLALASSHLPLARPVVVVPNSSGAPLELTPPPSRPSGRLLAVPLPLPLRLLQLPSLSSFGCFSFPVSALCTRPSLPSSHH